MAVESNEVKIEFFYFYRYLIEDFGKDGESEFCITLASSDFFVSNGIDSGGESDGDWNLGLGGADAFEVVEVIGDEMVKLVMKGKVDLLIGFIVSVEIALGGIDSGLNGSVEFTFACDIKKEILVSGNF